MIARWRRARPATPPAKPSRPLAWTITRRRMPCIADDRCINSDDNRAAAGFRVLGELAKKTQALFFTHHGHLLGVAREALGAPTAGVTLPVAASPPAQHSQAA